MNLDKIKTELKKLIAQFTAVHTDKGDISIDGELAVGAEVNIGGEAVEDGDYTTDDGKVITIKDGKIEAIVEPQPEPEPEPTEPTEPTEPEPEPTEPTEPEPTEPDDALEAKVAELEAKVAELEAKINEALEQLTKPVVEPVVEQFSKLDVDNTKNKAARILSHLNKK